MWVRDASRGWIPEGAPKQSKQNFDWVSTSNAEGPPVPIPNTEVKLCSAENTCLETSREDRSMLTQKDASSSLRQVGDFNVEGPPVPIPNTEVKLYRAENTCLETSREDRSLPTP